MYIADNTEFMLALRTEKSLLVVAGCGTGKTFGAITSLENDKFIFLVPNRTVKEQLAIEYNLEQTGEGTSLKTLFQQGAKRIVCCYESLERYTRKNGTTFLNDFVLVLDEVHSIIGELHFRDNLRLFDLPKEFKRAIFLTATPEALQIKDNCLMGTPVKIMKFEQVKKLDVEIRILKSKKDKITKETLAGLQTVMQSWKNPTLFIISTGVELLKKAGYSEIISSNNRQSGNYKSLVAGILPEGLTVSTNLFNAGLSIRNEDTVNLVIDFKGYDLNYWNLTQLIQRFRDAKKINVFILERYRSTNKATTEEIKEEIQKQFKLLEEGEIKLHDSIIFNPFFSSMIELSKNKFSLNWDNLPATEQLLNGYKNQTDQLINQLKANHNWKSKGVHSYIEDMAIEEITSPVKQKPKTILKEFFLKNGEITSFTTAYFLYRMNPDNNHNFNWLQREYLPQLNKLNLVLNNNDSLKGALKDLVSSVKNEDQQIEKSLIQYFAPSHKFSKTSYTDEQKKKLRDALLEVKKDNIHLSQTRKILEEHLGIVLKSSRVTPNQKIEQYFSWLKLKIKRVGNQIIIQ